MFPIFRCIQFLISWQDAGGSAGVAAASFMRKYSGVLLRLCSNQAVIHRIDSVKTLMSTVTLHGGQGDSCDGVTKDGQVKLSKFTNIHDSLDHDAGRLLAELTASADLEIMLPILGTATAAIIPSMTITMISSTSVKPSFNFLDAYIDKLSVCSFEFIINFSRANKQLLHQIALY